MLTFAAFILPALAIGTILWFLSRPLPLIFGSRLGVYYEQLEGLPEGFAELVFEHRSLPVFAALCQNLDQQRFVVMLTEGQGKKYLHSTSSKDSPEVREPELCMINVDADYVEDVLKAHMQELSAWSEEGFVAANGSGLAGFSSFCRDFIAHPFFGKHFCGCGMSMLSGFWHLADTCIGPPIILHPIQNRILLKRVLPSERPRPLMSTLICIGPPIVLQPIQIRILLKRVRPSVRPRPLKSTRQIPKMGKVLICRFATPRYWDFCLWGADRSNLYANAFFQHPTHCFLLRLYRCRC